MTTNYETKHDSDASAPKGSIPLCRVAVVVPTVLRPTLERAVASVYAQQITEPCHLLIGVDMPLGSQKVLEYVEEKKPPHWHVTILNVGYSTSVRHGGVHPAGDGGSLRTVLSYLANSRYVAYLDDDNWWDPRHLPELLAAVDGHEWAFSLRWFVDRESSQPWAVDQWESVGPGRGVFQEHGGFADPNTLLIDKLACEPVLRWWSIPLPGDNNRTADRNVFEHLRRYRGRGSEQATCYYTMDPDDGLHPQRMAAIAGLGTNCSANSDQQIASRDACTKAMFSMLPVDSERRDEQGVALARQGALSSSPFNRGSASSVCNGGFSIVVPTAYGQMIVNRHDINQTGALFRSGRSPDDAEISMLARVLVAMAASDPIVVDVGANVGAFSLALSAVVGPRGKVHAFEAQRIIFKMLAGSIALNSILNVFCYHMAVGDHEGQIEIPQFDYSKPLNFGSIEFGGDQQREPLDQARGHNAARVECVPLTTLDRFAFERLDLLKVDVEGMEVQVLEGARETIRRCRPIMFVEFLKSDRGALCRWLAEEDYVILNNKMNFLCVPRECSDRFAVVDGRIEVQPV